MQELIAASKVGISTGIAMLGSMFASMNIEDGKISIPIAVTCTVFICGIVWWLSSRFQKIADQAEQTNKRLEAIETRLEQTEQRQKKGQ